MKPIGWSSGTNAGAACTEAAPASAASAASARARNVLRSVGMSCSLLAPSTLKTVCSVREAPLRGPGRDPIHVDDLAVGVAFFVDQAALRFAQWHEPSGDLLDA